MSLSLHIDDSPIFFPPKRGEHSMLDDGVFQKDSDTMPYK